MPDVSANVPIGSITCATLRSCSFWNGVIATTNCAAAERARGFAVERIDPRLDAAEEHIRAELLAQHFLRGETGLRAERHRQHHDEERRRRDTRQRRSRLRRARRTKRPWPARWPKPAHECQRTTRDGRQRADDQRLLAAVLELLGEGAMRVGHVRSLHARRSGEPALRRPAPRARPRDPPPCCRTTLRSTPPPGTGNRTSPDSGTRPSCHGAQPCECDARASALRDGCCSRRAAASRALPHPRCRRRATDAADRPPDRACRADAGDGRCSRCRAPSRDASAGTALRSCWTGSRECRGSAACSRRPSATFLSAVSQSTCFHFALRAPSARADARGCRAPRS